MQPVKLLTIINIKTGKRIDANVIFNNRINEIKELGEHQQTGILHLYVLSDGDFYFVVNKNKSVIIEKLEHDKIKELAKLIIGNESEDTAFNIFQKNVIGFQERYGVNKRLVDDDIKRVYNELKNKNITDDEFTKIIQSGGAPPGWGVLKYQPWAAILNIVFSVLGFIPIVFDVADIIMSYLLADEWGLAFSAIGLIPIIGDVFQIVGGVVTGIKVYKKAKTGRKIQKSKR